MPNIKSSKKDVLRIQKRTLRNASARSKTKTSVTKLYKFLDSEDFNADKAKLLMHDVQKTIDSFASKGVYHKKTASRKVSRINTKLKAKLLSLSGQKTKKSTVPAAADSADSK